MPKIVILDQDTLGNVQNLQQLHSLGEVTSYPYTPAAKTQERVKDAQIVVTNKVELSRPIIENAPGLQLICVAATGTNNIDHQAAEERGIPVRNAKGYSTHSVAQHTFSMLFYLYEKLRYYDDYIRRGDYAQSPIFTHLGRPFNELYNKHFGIIGLGAIGQEVAKIASAFGCRVSYHSTSGRNTEQPFQQMGLEALLESADILSIHAPLNAHTQNLVGKKELARMKNTAILLNTGRGGIIDEEALAQALEAEQIQAAGLDVLAQEPISEDNPLNFVSDGHRLLITPHIAWTAIEARERLIDIVSSHIRQFLEEKNR